MKLFHAPILILAVGLTVTACSEPPEPSRQGETAAVSGVALVQKGPDEAAIAANNRGVGLMGRFAYIEAEQIFAQLAQNHPEWLDVQVNLAIAALNRQQEGDETRALAIVEGVIRADPS
ncbi:MAG: hypothetical protein GY731_19390, partial [Gammaproteobacteria bacterium]|nr:hypothetical protein [Gammaproteobacteria bacterium]